MKIQARAQSEMGSNEISAKRVSNRCYRKGNFKIAKQESESVPIPIQY